MKPASLETACSLFLEHAKTNPFDTWLIVENEDIKRRAFEIIQTPVLETRITTVKTLAHTILTEKNSGIRIISPEEQYLLFSAYGKEIFGKTLATKTLTENLIDLYITLTLNKTACPTDTEKGKYAAEVFSRYAEWCRKNHAADAISAISYAVPYAEQMHPAFCICAKLQSITPLAETLLSAFSPDALRIEPGMPDMTLPKTVQEISAYKNLREELAQTMEKICRLEESGISGSDILLLAPSLQTLLPLLEEITADFYINQSIPLTFKTSERKSILNLPLIRAVLAFVSAAKNPQETDLSLILESPHFRFRQSRVRAGQLRKAVKMTGCTNWRSIESLLAPSRKHDWQKSEDAKLQAVLCDILDTAESRQKTAKTLRERIAALRADLLDIGWMYAPLTGTESAARTAFLRLLERLESAGTADLRCSLSEFQAILARGCKKNAGIPYPENETAFRLGKIRSAAGTKTPYVFIVGLTAKNIPNISATLPLLTVRETKALLPDRYKKAAEDTAYYLAEALHSASTALYLSYAESNGRNSESPSPYLTRFAEPKPAKQLELLHAVSGNQKTAGRLIAEQKELPPVFGIRDLADTAVRIKIENCDRYAPGDYTACFAGDSFDAEYAQKEHVSPTFLENYALCPFSWYLTHHLHLENPQDFTAEHIRIGTVMHNVLEQYFRKHPCITADMREDAYTEISSLLREEMEKTGIDTPSWKAKYLQYCGFEMLESALQKIIDTEIQLAEEGFSTGPEWLERDVSAVFDGITVSGRVDRVILRGSEFRVLDYKTGKPKNKSDVPKGLVLQLPAYTEGIAQETALTPLTGYYLQTSPTHVGVIDLFPAGAYVMITEAKERISEILASIRSGVCAAKPDCGVKYCAYRSICRNDDGGEND